jgi:hypothetical protein
MAQLLSMLSGFPSAHDESGATKGGIILAKIHPSSSTPGILLNYLYK